MPKRITILDPNGAEVANSNALPPITNQAQWHAAVNLSCSELAVALKRENPKLGTYTVTVKEVE